MKKNSFFLFFLMLVLSTKAQVSTTLNVQTAPTAVLSEWSVKNAIVTLIVTKVDSIPQQVIFKTEIKLIDGTVIGVTDITKATPMILTKGTRVYFSKDVMPLETMSFTGKYKTILDRTGKLPADNYQFCVQLLSQGAGGLQPLVAAKCKNFNMAALQLPILVMPANNADLNKLVAQTAITFRWSPLIPQILPPPTYRLQVFEILANQQPVQALRSNQPLLDVSVRAITQYIWRPGLAFNTTDSLPVKFIWTLQTLDDTGLPAVQTDGNGESRSEPFIFTIGANTGTKKLLAPNNSVYHLIRSKKSKKIIEVKDTLFLEIENNYSSGSNQLTYTIQNSSNKTISPSAKLDVVDNDGVSRIVLPVHNSVVAKGEKGILTISNSGKKYTVNFKRE